MHLGARVLLVKYEWENILERVLIWFITCLVGTGWARVQKWGLFGLCSISVLYIFGERFYKQSFASFISN